MLRHSGEYYNVPVTAEGEDLADNLKKLRVRLQFNLLLLLLLLLLFLLLLLLLVPLLLPLLVPLLLVLLFLFLLVLVLLFLDCDPPYSLCNLPTSWQGYEAEEDLVSTSQIAMLVSASSL